MKSLLNDRRSILIRISLCRKYRLCTLWHLTHYIHSQVYQIINIDFTFLNSMSSHPLIYREANNIETSTYFLYRICRFYSSFENRTSTPLQAGCKPILLMVAIYKITYKLWKKGGVISFCSAFEVMRLRPALWWTYI